MSSEVNRDVTSRQSWITRVVVPALIRINPDKLLNLSMPSGFCQIRQNRNALGRGVPTHFETHYTLFR